MNYKSFHKLSYGLYIVSSVLEGTKAGYIANTVFQLTSTPPKLALSCHKENDTLRVILESGIFSVSVLKQDASTTLIGEFGFMSSSGFDKFAKVKTETMITGAPVVVDSCVAWFDCRVTDTLDCGSHMLIVGEVADSRLLLEDAPLTYAYYRDKYKLFSPRNSPTYIEKSKLEEEKPVPVTEEEKPQADFIDSDNDEPYICEICGYIYRPEDGDPSADIPPGTPFSDLPEDYRCPLCNAGKEYFKPLY